MPNTAPTGPPKHSVILCHPSRKSFSAAVAKRYCETVEACGQEVVLRDLYAMGFDPVLKATERPTADDFVLAGDVADELALLSGTSMFVLVYPVWFGMPPAMLKGYIDRVLGAGFSFRHLRQRSTHPLMTGARMLSITSSGTSLEWLEEQGAWLALRAVFDRYLEHAFSLTSSDHIHAASISGDTKPYFIEEHLRAVEQAAQKACARVAPAPPVLI